MLLNNRYQVIQTLGAGGFGQTFLAEDTQMPSSRRCVIKQLRPIENNPQIYQLVQQRFQREAAILEDLGGNSDQIPTLYAYFQAEGQFYLVQEWISGDTLTAKLQKQGLWRESAVAEMLLNLLPVLEYIHFRRIIHRDIKPDNIILRYGDGKPVLIDFGAVRESMATVVNSQGHPTSSIVIGTPGYMASEQAAGRPVYSSDLYSLGLTAIYLLTGKQPQELELDSRSGEIIWYQHAVNISPTLAEVITRAIAYHPRDRFASAREMLLALQLGSSSIPPTVPYQHPLAANAPPSQPTVTVSPGSTSPPPTQVPAQRVFLSSVIVGGLIGTAIIIGFALNRPPQPVTQSTGTLTAPDINQAQVPSTTPPVNSPSEQIPEPSPIASNPVTPPGQWEQSTETLKAPDINQAQVPGTTPPVNSPSEEIPEPSPIASNPVTSPFNPDQPSSSPSVVESEILGSSPTEAVQNYYVNINQGKYETAWNLLAPSLQNNQRLHPEGYLSYINWWGGEVDSVSVEEVSLLAASGNTATVNAKFQYLMKTGKRVAGSLRFYLLWDASNSRWVVSEVK